MTTPLTENKIILITRKTRLDELIVRYNTLDQAKFVIESQGIDFSDYVNEHELYYAQKQIAIANLETQGRIQNIDRDYLPNFLFGKNDLVVALGQDGLVANALKYLNGQALVGVNPDPKRWDGVLLPFKTTDLPQIIPEAFAATRNIKEVTMAKATLNTGQTMYGVNDLFIGPKTHFSARYEIAIDGQTERHSSSGVIVSTGLGSTGWLSSLLAGATGITSRLSRKDLHMKQNTQFGWDSNYLYYTVREPFPSAATQTDIVFGKITQNNKMHIISQMPEQGVIFSDGIQNDYLEFNSGVEAQISLAEKRGLLVT